MSETTTIDITPVTNPERILAYAEKHKTKAPWDHIAGQLAALADLAQALEDLKDQHNGDELAWAFVRTFETTHATVSNEFLRFFGTPE